MPQTWAALETGIGVVAFALVTSVVGAVVLSKYLPQLPYGRRLVLAGVAGAGGVGSIAGDADNHTPWPALGAVALAVTDLRPSGNAEFPDPEGAGVITVAVVSDSGFINKGTQVKVTEVAGPRVLVRSTTTPQT